MEVVDKHAPFQNKRVSNKHSPWITYELTRKIYKRNYYGKMRLLNVRKNTLNVRKMRLNIYKMQPLNVRKM